eukprot:UN30742
MEEELNEFILSDDGSPATFEVLGGEDKQTAGEIADQYAHIRGISDANLDNLTSAEMSALSIQDGFIYKVLPTETLKDCLFYFHDTWGFQWFGIVLVAPWIVKAVLVLPLTIKTQKHMEWIAPTQSESMQKVKEIQVQFGHDRALFSKKMNELKSKYGYNPSTAPYRMFGSAIVQAPFHMTFFFSLRTMWPGFGDWKEGGALWFTDLAVPDPTWALPVICGTFMLANTELNMMAQQHKTEAAGMMKTMMRGFSFLMIPMFVFFPSGFTLYTASNILGFACQSALLRND